MHHDKKVGLGLGILLVGIVGAFFFREEPRPLEPLPELRSAELLDREITDSLVGNPKPDTDLEKYERQYKPYVNLQGIETAGIDETRAGVPPSDGNVFDEEFDFLNEPGEPASQESTLAGNQAEQSPLTEAQSGPAQDVIVSRTLTPREHPAAKGMFPEDRSSPQDASPQPFLEDDRPLAEELDRASEQPTETDAAESSFYTVQKGDTLSGIASRLTGRRGDYREIFELNRDQLSSPDDLRPGMRLKIPVQGQSDRTTEVLLTAPQESPSPDSSLQTLERATPKPSKQDRRVIVPRRVRLNEPIANNPAGLRREEPRVRFTLEPSREETNGNLPTLEGLEPLDLPH